MNTPAEKAKELVDKFKECVMADSKWEEDELEDAKKAANIAVDEILLIFEGLHKPEYTMFDIYEPKQYHMEGETEFNGYTMSEYFEQVKKEINLL